MYYLSGTFCPPVPAKRNSNAIIFSSTKQVQFTCHIGYRFPDGQQSKILNCEDDLFAVENAECLGNHFLNNIISFFQFYMTNLKLMVLATSSN